MGAKVIFINSSPRDRWNVLLSGSQIAPFGEIKGVSSLSPIIQWVKEKGNEGKNCLKVSLRKQRARNTDLEA